jgi:beta-lactamase superfamily II metal-dependent hydrolase
LGIFALGRSPILETGIEEIVRLSSTVILKLFEFSRIFGNLWIVPEWALWVSLPLVLIFYRAKPIFLSLALGIFLFRMAPIFDSSLLDAFRSCRKIVSEQRATPPVKKTAKALRVEQLDIGQGDSSILWADGPSGTSLNSGLYPSVGMVDTGSKYGLADDQWIQLLAQRQIRAIDWVLLTHLDEDHSGGLHRLSGLLPIRCVVLSPQEKITPRGLAFVKSLEEKNIRISTFAEECIPFPVYSLVAEAGKKGKKRPRANEFMLALEAPLLGGGFYLSAGDASTSDEMRLLSLSKYRKGANRSSTGPRILKLSHHGSRTSSSRQFLEKLNPSEVWISAGRGNRYGHPSPEVLKTLECLKIPVLRTDRIGLVSSIPAREAFFLRLLSALQDLKAEQKNEISEE